MWEHKDAALLLSFSYHAGKQHSKQMYQCPSQADQARFILHDECRDEGLCLQIVTELGKHKLLKNIIIVMIRTSYSPQAQGESTKMEFQFGHTEK